MLNSDLLSEEIHYELVPSDNDMWDVRIKEAYPETVIRFGTVSLDGDTQEMRWNMSIVSSPDEDLSTEDLTFQEYCGRILESIMAVSLSEGTAILTDKDTNEQYVGEALREDYDEYKLTNNDSKESIN
jgi:hypothetical protein|tara:strand:+ start:12513 stop:12896 length:384 start_codon:yes stop_codon:yes gene_type:complete